MVIDKDIQLLLLGALTGLISAFVLAILNSWLSTRSEKMRRIEKEADERVALVYEFLSRGITTNKKRGPFPKLAWLVVVDYTGPKKFSISKLNLVTQRIVPLSERTVLLGELFTIGRDSYNHLVLPSIEVNKLHALIRYENDNYVFYDVSGSAGSIINKVKTKRAALGDGDWIDIQGYSILYADQEVTIEKESMPFESRDRIREALEKSEQRLIVK
jgi:hypothetical protein